MIDAGLLVVGLKGLRFYEEVRRSCNVRVVSSYLDRGVRDDSHARIVRLAAKLGHRYVERKNLGPEVLDQTDVVLVVGWQYLLHWPGDKLVVFHDSLLPRYRGFAPTVNALINGETQIGVTALRPGQRADSGEILAQAALDVTYPIKIATAFDRLSGCYQELGRRIVAMAEKGPLLGTPQKESEATYSIWRSDDDYWLDWGWDAARISRFVDATGWPFSGARTRYLGDEIIVDNVTPIDDLAFELRHPGKIWALRGGRPEVTCGQGMLRIDEARFPDGKPVVFSRVRARLGQ